MNDEQIRIDVISDSNKLLEIEDEWNRLVRNCSANPFFLAGFVKQFLSSFESQRWTPAVLVLSVNKRIVGIAPLIVRKRLGVRIAKIPLEPEFSPDFVLDVQHREDCVVNALNYLFDKLHCQLVYLVLPGDSPNLRIFKQKKFSKGIQFSVLPAMGHYVLYTEDTWAEFAKSRGKKFREDFRRTERYLDAAGSWRVCGFTSVEKERGNLDVLGKILDVERMSWKQAWRAEMGEKMDKDLLRVWEGSCLTAEKEPSFRWEAWVLELNGQALAYALVFLFKDLGIVLKTSYDARYRRFSPGVYVMNAAIRALLNEHNIRKIDFLTDVPFVKTWTSLCLPRVTVVMSRRWALSVAVKFSFYVQNIESLSLIFALVRARVRVLQRRIHALSSRR